MSRVLLLLLLAGCQDGMVEDPLGIVSCDYSWRDVYLGNVPESCERVCEAPPELETPGCMARGLQCPGTFEADGLGVRGCCSRSFERPVIEFYACDD